METGVGKIAHAYYLRAGDRAAGASLLSRSGVGGYAWPSANGWVPLAVRGRARDRDLIGALGPGELILRYAAAGEGWSFELLSADRCFMRYARSLSPEARIEAELVEENLPLLLRLVVEHNPRARSGTARAAELRVETLAVLYSAPSPKRSFPALLGLEPCAGLFYDELPSDIHERGLGVVRVPSRGSRSRPPP